MIETKSFDLGQPVNQAGEIVNFTDVNNLRWAGVVDLPPWGELSLGTNIRNDLYILQGELMDRAGPS